MQEKPNTNNRKTGRTNQRNYRSEEHTSELQSHAY